MSAGRRTLWWVQRAGKAAMDADAYVRGNPVAPGTVLQ